MKDAFNLKPLAEMQQKFMRYVEQNLHVTFNFGHPKNVVRIQIGAESGCFLDIFGLDA